MQLVLQRAYRLDGCAPTHSRPQPGDHIALMHVMCFVHGKRECWSIRHPKRNMRIGIGEPARQYADDGVRIGVETDLLADHRCIAGEAPLKEIPGEQNNVIGPWLVLIRGEHATKLWLHAEYGKQIPRARPG